MKKIVFVFIISFLSCSIFAQNYANEFQKKQNDSLSRDVIYLYVSHVLDYKNEAIEKIPNFNEIDEDSQNELINKYSISKKIIKDSILSMYKKELIKGLERLGLKVIISYPGDFPSKLDERHHILNTAQIELEEFIFKDSIYGYDEGNLKVFHKDLNGISFNTWIVYNEIDSSSKTILFNNRYDIDKLNGQISKDNTDYYADFNITRLTPNDAYYLAYLNGKESAIYFYNFLLNKYVKKKSLSDKNYYGIDANSKKIISKNEPFDYFEIINQ